MYTCVRILIRLSPALHSWRCIGTRRPSISACLCFASLLGVRGAAVRDGRRRHLCMRTNAPIICVPVCTYTYAFDFFTARCCVWSASALSLSPLSSSVSFCFPPVPPHSQVCLCFRLFPVFFSFQTESVCCCFEGEERRESRCPLEETGD